MCHTHLPGAGINSVSIVDMWEDRPRVVISLSEDDCQYEISFKRLASIWAAWKQGQKEFVPDGYGEKSEAESEGCHGWPAARTRRKHTHIFKNLYRFEVDTAGCVEMAVSSCACHVAFPLFMLLDLFDEAQNDVSWAEDELRRRYSGDRFWNNFELDNFVDRLVLKNGD